MLWTASTASILLEMISFLTTGHLSCEGLYEQSGASFEENDLLVSFQKGNLMDLRNLQGNSIAMCIKKVLRDIMSPLFPRTAYGMLLDGFASTGGISLSTMSRVMEMTPEIHRSVLEQLLNHLQKVANNPINNVSMDKLAGTIGVDIIRRMNKTDDKDCT